MINMTRLWKNYIEMEFMQDQSHPKATSFPSSDGIALELRAAATNLHSPEKILRAFSISASSYNKF